MPVWRRSAWIFVFSALLGCGGCGQMIADRLLHPHPDAAREQALETERRLVEHEWKDHLREFSWHAPEGFTLRALILTPRADESLLAPAATLPKDSVAMEKPNLLDRLFGLKRVHVPAPAPRGLIVILHGLGDRKEGMLSYAQLFARHDYVAVVADLRAHGESEGRYTTFGMRERWDMVALLNSLQLDGYDTGHVGVLGTSLGAATGLQWAGVDPRVKAVVAIASFANLAEEVSHLNDIQGTHLSPFVLHIVESAAENAAEFRINDVSPLQAVRERAVPLYLVHGQTDGIILPEQSEELFAAASGPTVLELVSGAGHHDVLQKLGPTLLNQIEDWMDHYVANDPTAPMGWVKRYENRNMGTAIASGK